MKKIHSRRLTLNRETLAPMTADSLDQVRGGIAPILSQLFCPRPPDPNPPPPSWAVRCILSVGCPGTVPG